ncbi:MAG: hypothetical protein LBN09_00270 [Clostridioides sp.]|jgi:hypothetical protein|nr:hypothetical protein [Clostridioides sp.]
MFTDSFIYASAIEQFFTLRKLNKKNFPIKKLETQLDELIADVFNTNQVEKKRIDSYSDMKRMDARSQDSVNVTICGDEGCIIVQRYKQDPIKLTMDNKNCLIYDSIHLLSELIDIGEVDLSSPQISEFCAIMIKYNELIDYYVDLYKRIIDKTILKYQRKGLDETGLVLCWNSLNRCVKSYDDLEVKDYLKNIRRMDEKLENIHEYWKFRQLYQPEPEPSMAGDD